MKKKLLILSAIMICFNSVNGKGGSMVASNPTVRIPQITERLSQIDAQITDINEHILPSLQNPKENLEAQEIYMSWKQSVRSLIDEKARLEGELYLLVHPGSGIGQGLSPKTYNSRYVDA